jgi:hypothetical protein
VPTIHYNPIPALAAQDRRLEIKRLARLRVDIGLFRICRIGIFASDLNIVDEFAGCTTGDAGGGNAQLSPPLPSAAPFP